MKASDIEAVHLDSLEYFSLEHSLEYFIVHPLPTTDRAAAIYCNIQHPIPRASCCTHVSNGYV